MSAMSNYRTERYIDRLQDKLDAANARVAELERREALLTAFVVAYDPGPYEGTITAALEWRDKLREIRSRIDWILQP